MIKPFNKIIVEFPKYEKMRYRTLGDYFMRDGDMVIQVAQSGNWMYDLAIVIHELSEYVECLNKGIKEKDISKFDIRFEKDRDKGLIGQYDEPGDDPDAPYLWPHQNATIIERLFLQNNGLLWKDYELYLQKFEDRQARKAI